MTRKKKETDVDIHDYTDEKKIDEMDVGRIAGLVKRKNPTLWDTIRKMAADRGMSVSEYLSKIISEALMIEQIPEDMSARDLVRAIMVVGHLQEIELSRFRAMTELAATMSLEKALQEMNTLMQFGEYYARSAGYVAPEEIEKKKEEKEKYEKIFEMFMNAVVNWVANNRPDLMEKLVDIARAGAATMGLTSDQQ